MAETLNAGPKVSLIVPVYNAEKFIGTCLDSVLAQTMADFEVIVVDDGSSDGSLELCEGYARKDARIKVLHKGNGGVSSARNFGLEKAVGEWVFFLDADDRLKPDALSSMVARSVDAELVFGGYEVYDEQNHLTYAIDERVDGRLDKYQALEQMFRPWHYRYYGYVWGKLFSRAIVERQKLRFDEAISFNEDRLFTVQYICGIDRVAYFTEPVYEYVENPFSAMASLNRAFNPKFFTDLDAFRKMKGALAKLPEGGAVLPLLKSEAGLSFRRLSRMMRSHKGTGAWPRVRLYLKMLGILSFREFWQEALLPLMFRQKQV